MNPLVFVKAEASNADAGCGYDGPGVYLYPSWGKPRPYLVRPVAGSAQMVEFRDPASAALLWTQSLSICGQFAGKLSSLQEVGSQPF